MKNTNFAHTTTGVSSLAPSCNIYYILALTASKIPFMYFFPCGLSPNFHIHVSLSVLYIPRIGPHISLQQNRQTDPGNI
jgi:hypothetical protein